MSFKYKTAITIGEVEHECVVEYDRHAGYAGDRIDPPENDSVEIITILVKDGRDISDEISDADRDQLNYELLEDWAEDAAMAAEYRAEQRHRGD